MSQMLYITQLIGDKRTLTPYAEGNPDLWQSSVFIKTLQPPFQPQTALNQGSGVMANKH